MKNNKPTTEELLQTGKNVSLSLPERELMKSELLSYAQFHGLKPAPAPVTSWTSWWWVRASAVASLVFVLAGGTGAASTNSLPGEPLYAVKIHMVEELVKVSNFSEQKQLDYQTTLAERRMVELKQLANSNRLTPEIAAVVETELENVVEEIDGILSADTDESLEATDVLETTNDVVAVTKAAGRLVSKELSVEASEVFETTIDDAIAVHEKELDEFIDTEGDEAIEAYVTTQVRLLTAELAEDDVASTTVAIVKEYLEDISEALDNDDIDEASQSASDALRQIETEEYFSDLTDETAEIE